MNMKKMIALLTTLFALVALLVLPAGAADLTAGYTYANEKLTVTGSGAAANGLVSIYVLEAAANAGTVSDSARPAVVEALMASGTGDFSIEITFPLALTTGQYKVNVASGTSVWESAVFNHINAGELAALSGNVNTSADAAEIEAWLMPLNIALELPSITYTSEYLLAVRPAAGYTDSQLQAEMQRSSALYLLQQGEVPENLAGYEAYLIENTLNLDCLAQYENMSTDIKTAYLAAVSTMNLKTTTALEDIYTTGLIQTAKAAASWQDLRNIIRGETETTAFFTQKIAVGTNYNQLTYPEVVFQELYRNKDSLTDMTALKSLFANAVTSAYRAEQNAAASNSSNRGNGGGGGGMGGVSQWGSDASQTVQDIQDALKPDTKPSSSFYDITGHWAEADIQQLAALGVASGYPDGGFHPDAFISRGEYVKLLCELFQIAPVSGSSFGDVPADAWYAPYAEAAAAAGLVLGDENGSFRAGDMVTRQDAAVILGRFLKLEEASVEGKFTDSAQIAPYAAGYVAAMANEGLISGMDDGSFAPGGHTTRAQAAAMLLRARNWTTNGRNGGAAA